MPVTAPTLSIAVPTYQDGPFLTPLIESIAVAAEGLAIEVVVSDNNSPDGTGAILIRLRDKYTFLRAIKNDETTSADENMARAFAACTGSYVWCVGSDDVVTAQSLGVIVRQVESRVADEVIVGNWIIGDAECRPVRRALRNGQRTLGTPRHSVPALGVAATFMTAVVLPRELALPLVDRYRDGAGLMVWKIAVELLAMGTPGRFVEEPLAVQRVEDAVPYNFVPVVCRTSEEFLVSLAERSPVEGRAGVQKLRKKLQRALVARFVTSAKLRSPGLDGATWRELRRIYRRNPAFWVWVAPLWILPDAVLRRGYRVLRAAFRLFPPD